MRLTDEQVAAVDAFSGGDHLRTIAYAGAGKTSTLVSMARARPQASGLYVAFNKAIASDAGAKFRGTRVDCRTAHSLAYRTVKGMGYSDEKMRASLTSRALKLPRVELPHIGGLVGSLVVGTIRRFCQSADNCISIYHVPKLAKPVDDDVWLQIRATIANLAEDVWSHMVALDDTTPLGHDGYLKLWALHAPQLHDAYRYILIDEAQDLNPVLIGVLAAQRCQLVSVGDSHQQIYAWRGAIDALEQLPGHICRLTQSFRFGANIAAHANSLLIAMGETHPLRGNGRTDDIVCDPDSAATAILCRTNAGVIDQLLTELMLDARVYIPGGAGELTALIEDAERLQDGAPARTADLLGFRAWREVCEHAETEEGAGLRVLVSLVDSYGCHALLKALGQVLNTPTPGCVTISTAHKAKGLEWSQVEIAGDFMKTGKIDIAERRLFYVACTRAKSELAVSETISAAYRRIK